MLIFNNIKNSLSLIKIELKSNGTGVASRVTLELIRFKLEVVKVEKLNVFPHMTILKH